MSMVKLLPAAMFSALVSSAFFPPAVTVTPVIAAVPVFFTVTFSGAGSPVVAISVSVLLAAVEISSTLFLPLLKTAGIAVVTRIGADLCRDAGESAMASAVEMAGAMGALLAVLPLMQAAWEVLRSLL